MAMIALALLLLPSVCVVSALRETHGLAEQQGNSFWNCRSSKCTGVDFFLKGELGGRLQFQDCKVNKSNPFYTADDRMCQETCKVVLSGESHTVKVERKSGAGKQSCSMVEGELCEDACCEAKCSAESYELRANMTGKFPFQKCQLKGEVHLAGSGTMCSELCIVLHENRSEEAPVVRRSGSGPPRCEFINPPLQELAADFVEQLEKEALRLEEYTFLPMMKAWKIVRFLEAVRDQILVPEMAAAGGHGFSREISKKVVQNVAIIGDLHGQLFNLIAYLLEIKEQYKDKGYSSLPGSSLLFCDPRMKYVFMGDYVDRGERGVELLMLLLAYKARCPQSMILLQGNHEKPEMWSKYGFSRELRYKFRSQVAQARVDSVTETLPYVAVLPGHWMATHGGISPSFVKACSGKAGRFESCLDRTIGSSLVWADPHDGDGWIQSRRGPGIYKFGMDVAEDFLKSNGLGRIFRGHEQVQRGVTVLRRNGYSVVTVFSAADYVGLFCLNGRLPPFDRDMFSYPGEGNDGAIMLQDIVGKKVKTRAWPMSGTRTRSLAGKFAGATCGRGGLIETSRTSLESFIEENHKRLDQGNSSCSLDEAEANVFEEEVRQILTSSSDLDFEARKLVDLEGEALIHRDGAFICKSMIKDHVTLRVYKELQGANAEVLEHDIQTRRDELLNESTDVEP